MSAFPAFAAARTRCPLIAILRGVRPDEAVAIGEALVAAGFAMIEVPLNSPEPFASIARLADRLGPDALIGAGTVLRAEDAGDAARAGARLLLAPNCDPMVIGAARDLDIPIMPGVATASEAFAAIAAGASALKLFPANTLGAETVAAWRAVLPADMPIFAVGGVDEAGFEPFVRAGVAGFGLGSSLYRPGDPASTVARNAQAAVAAWQAKSGE